MPGNATSMEHTTSELLEADTDVHILAEKSSDIATKLKKLEQNRNRNQERQDRKKAAAEAIPTTAQPQKQLNASTPANYGGGITEGNAKDISAFGADYKSPDGLTSQGANADTDKLPGLYSRASPQAITKF